MEKLKKICLSKMNTENNFKNLCDLTTNLVGLPKGSLALKTRKTEYQVPRMVAAMISRLEDETHRDIIAKVLGRDRTSINHYERCHSANYSSFPLYRDTFNKVFNAYTEIKDAKLTFVDLYNLQEHLRKRITGPEFLLDQTSTNLYLVMKATLELLLRQSSESDLVLKSSTLVQSYSQVLKAFT